jgi:hypothetical protein
MNKPSTLLWLAPMACFALTSLGCTKSDSLGAAGNDDSGVGGSAGSGGATPTGGTALAGSDGMSSIGGSITTTGAGGMSGAAGGPWTMCEVATATPGPFSIAFRFRNNGTAPVFLHTNCDQFSYDVSDCWSGYVDQVAEPVSCASCLCGSACATCGVCAPNGGLEVDPGMTTQAAWDAYQAGQPQGESCWTNFALGAGLYRVSILTYATQTDATTQNNPLRVLTTDFALSSATTVVEIVNSPTVPDGGIGSSISLLDMLPANNEIDTWVHAGGVSLITDQTGLYNRIDGAAPKYIDRGWVSSVYVNYSQGYRTIQVAIHDMGSAANAQAIYNFALPASSVAISGDDNAVVDTGLSTAYAAYAYLGRFFIELNISEKSDAARYWLELFMSDILNRNSKGGPDGGNPACTCDVWSSPCPEGESSCVICSGFSSLCSQCPVPTNSQSACNSLGLRCAYDQSWCDCVTGDAGSPIWSCVFLVH